MLKLDAVKRCSKPEYQKFLLASAYSHIIREFLKFTILFYLQVPARFNNQNLPDEWVHCSECPLHLIHCISQCGAMGGSVHCVLCYISLDFPFECCCRDHHGSPHLETQEKVAGWVYCYQLGLVQNTKYTCCYSMNKLQSLKRRDMSRHDLALAQESCRGHGTFSPLCIMYYLQYSNVLGKLVLHEQKGWDKGEVGWYTQRVKTAWPCMGWL